MPEPKENETKNDFLKRCIPIMVDEGKPQNQATAICYSIFKKTNEVSVSGDSASFISLLKDKDK